MTQSGKEKEKKKTKTIIKLKIITEGLKTNTNRTKHF